MATWRLRTPQLFRKPAGTAVMLVSSCLISSSFVSSLSRHVFILRRYGLLASVLANRRNDFDKFLIYYNEQENDQGLSCWQQASCTFLCTSFIVLYSRYSIVCKTAGASVSATVQLYLRQLQVLRNKKIFTNPDSSYNGWGSATDGDLDAAYALLLAGQTWHDPLYTERGIKACSNPIVKRAIVYGRGSVT